MPRKAVEGGPGKLAPLNMRTTAEVRAKLEEAAAASGRSLTSEVEHRLLMSFEWERAFRTKDDMLAELKARIEKIASENLDAEMRRQGWTPVRGAGWLPPGAMNVPKSGFIDPDAPMPPPPVSLETIIEQAVARALEKALRRPARRRVPVRPRRLTGRRRGTRVRRTAAGL